MSAQWREQAMPGGSQRLVAGEADAALFCGAVTLERGDFLRHVHALAARLPDAPAVINLCERRDHFIMGFCAALLRGQVTLLPPSRASGVVDEVAMRHPGCYRLGDTASPLPCDVHVESASTGPLPHRPAAANDARIADGQLAMVGFTSGSTGAPTAHAKTWGALQQTNAANLHALSDLLARQAASIVATVPPQHMYGMELSVLLPLLGPFAVHPGRPFFPDDIARALAEVPAPRLLVTTPVHLRALLETDVKLPDLRAIVTATAPLSATLAAQAETRLNCEVRELFGSTETCVIAQRRTARDERWRLFDGVHLHPQPDGTRVTRASLPAPVLLADLMECVDGGRGFLLRGRQADLLEIAGKRASLSDLTRRLQHVPGVHDATMLQPDTEDASVRRLVAIIVAEHTLRDADILAAMRANTDPVFLPRRIIRVDALPRNDTGKLPRDALLALIARS